MSLSSSHNIIFLIINLNKYTILYSICSQASSSAPLFHHTHKRSLCLTISMTDRLNSSYSLVLKSNTNLITKIIVGNGVERVCDSECDCECGRAKGEY